MNLRNRVQLIGNLGANPIVRELESGLKVAQFSIATTDVYKRNGKYEKDTIWHKIVAWGKLADIAEKNLSIGSEVVIDGKIQNRTYNSSTGEKRYVTEIIANSMLCSPSAQKQQKEQTTQIA